MKPPSLLDIDGSIGEGGGQVLRTSLTLSALTSTPVRIRNIRARRTKPGLAPQHLTNVLALAAICDAKVKGALLRSTELSFTPRTKPQAGNYAFDVARAAGHGSAGSVTLILQTLLLPLAYASEPSRITLRGGTHVPWSPSYHYLADVFLPTVAATGINASCTLEQWGFYPRGGGGLRATIRTEPKSLLLSPLLLSVRGMLKSITGFGVCCNLPPHIAHRLADRATDLLAGVGLHAGITPLVITGPGPGAGIFLTAEYENCCAGFSAIGLKGKPAEQVAEEACRGLLAFHRSKASVDSHLADQLLLPLSLAKGQSQFVAPTLTPHLATNCEVIRQFMTATFDFQKQTDGSVLVGISGVGFTREDL